MKAQNVTSRLMGALNSGDVVKDYLLAFGVTNTSELLLPPVFNPKHEPEWNAFIVHLNLETEDQNRKYLYTILQFMKYMQAIKINPFVKPMQAKLTKVVGERPNVDKIFEELVKYRINKLAKDVHQFLIKTGLGSQLRRIKSKVEAVPLKENVLIRSSYVFEPKRKKETLDSCLTKLQGLLYNTTRIPIHLQEVFSVPTNPKSKARSKLPKYTFLFNQTSTFGWLPVLIKPKLSAYVIRAKDDRLVVRLEAYMVNDISLAPTKYDHNKKLVKYWTNSVKI